MSLTLMNINHALIATQSNNAILECTKYGTVMKCHKCKTCCTAKVSVTATDGKIHSLTLFNDIIVKIVGTDIRKDLLMAPPMKCRVDSSNVVYSIQKL